MRVSSYTCITVSLISWELISGWGIDSNFQSLEAGYGPEMFTYIYKYMRIHTSLIACQTFLRSSLMRFPCTCTYTGTVLWLIPMT